MKRATEHRRGDFGEPVRRRDVRTVPGLGRDRGFTLVEALIAFFLGVLVLGTAYYAWQYFSREMARGRVKQLLEQDCRLAMVRVNADVKSMKGGTFVPLQMLGETGGSGSGPGEIAFQIFAEIAADGSAAEEVASVAYFFETMGEGKKLLVRTEERQGQKRRQELSGAVDLLEMRFEKVRSDGTSDRYRCSLRPGVPGELVRLDETPDDPVTEARRLRFDILQQARALIPGTLTPVEAVMRSSAQARESASRKPGAFISNF